jgi:hypothetical protein
LAADAAALSADVDAARGLLAAREMAISRAWPIPRRLLRRVRPHHRLHWFLGLVGVWLLARIRVARDQALLADTRRAASGT